MSSTRSWRTLGSPRPCEGPGHCQPRACREPGSTPWAVAKRRGHARWLTPTASPEPGTGRKQLPAQAPHCASPWAAWCLQGAPKPVPPWPQRRGPALPGSSCSG
eukprot:3549900-Lingulodinium_polyedra.AAC.1